MPRITGAWLRLPPAHVPMLAGFARIENPCRTPVVITAAASTTFADVSLHRTSVVEGVSRMRAVPELTVPAKAAVELKPGGLHLMVMQSGSPPKAGDRVPITLRLKDGRRFTATFEVRGAALK